MGCNSGSHSGIGMSAGENIATGIVGAFMLIWFLFLGLCGLAISLIIPLAIAHAIWGL